MTRKYGAKKDANHGAMVGAFKKIGAHVLDLSSMGSGVPDLVVWCARRWVLVDIKNPKTGYGRRGLNKNQREWADAWQGGPVYLVATIDDVISLVTGRFDLVKHYPEDREPSPEEASDKPIVNVIETADEAIRILMGEKA